MNAEVLLFRCTKPRWLTYKRRKKGNGWEELKMIIAITIERAKEGNYLADADTDQMKGKDINLKYVSR